MFVRALIVLLVVLNLGVAAWWALQSEPAPLPPASQPPGIARLQLLRELPPSAARSATAPGSPRAAVDASTGAAEVLCFTFGPFADDATLQAAVTRVQPQVADLRTRVATATPARGYNVVLPPLASRELAQAAAARLVAAGFSDQMVINQGPDTNGIALGRYGSQQAAASHQAALQAAGFAAQLRPIGGGTAARWLDVQVDEGFDIAAARRASGASQQQSIGCEGFRKP